MAVGIALSCLNISLPEGVTAMDLTLCGPVRLYVSQGQRLPTLHPCPERSPQSNPGNAPGQGFRSVFHKTFQPGRAHRGGREGLDISPAPLHGDAPLPPACGQTELAEAGGWMR